MPASNDVKSLRLSIGTAVVVGLSLVSGTITVVGWANEKAAADARQDAAIERIEKSVVEIKSTQQSEARENRALRNSVRGLITELRVRGVVSETPATATREPDGEPPPG